MSVAAKTASPSLALSRGSGAPGTKASVTRNEWIARGLAGLRDVAPYAAIELILPGGSLIALGLWLYRRYQRKRAVTIGQLSTLRSSMARATILEPCT